MLGVFNASVAPIAELYIGFSPPCGDTDQEYNVRPVNISNIYK